MRAFLARLTAYRARGELLPIVTIAALALMVFGLALVSVGGMRWTVQSSIRPPSIIPAPPMPDPAAEATGHDRTASVFSPQALGSRTRFIRALALEPPYEPVDARTIMAANHTVILHDVEVPHAKAVCVDADAALWACGLQGRAALYNLIRREPVTCRPLAETEKDNKKSAIAATCQVRGKDLSTELIRTGYARPAGPASKDMLDAESEARAAGVGLWKNNWAIMQ